MTSSLVTGAAGFMGSHVVDHLIDMGHDVIALDDLSGGFRDNVNPSATFVEGSVVDPELVDRLFRENPIDYVYHLAAYAAEGLSHFIKRFNYTNNLIGSVNVINASVNSGRVKCLVFTSSIAVYGRNQVSGLHRRRLLYCSTVFSESAVGPYKLAFSLQCFRTSSTHRSYQYQAFAIKTP